MGDMFITQCTLFFFLLILSRLSSVHEGTLAKREVYDHASNHMELVVRLSLSLFIYLYLSIYLSVSISVAHQPPTARHKMSFGNRGPRRTL